MNVDLLRALPVLLICLLIMFSGSSQAQDAHQSTSPEPPYWANLWPSLYTSVPQARVNASFAWLGGTPARALIFGGLGCGGICGDSWLYSDSAGYPGWYETNGPQPEARQGAVLANYPPIGGAVLFGGSNNVTTFGDTWLFNVTIDEWQVLNTNASPGPRAFSAAVLDPASDSILLFGGMSSTGQALGDTWMFQGRGWTNVSTSQHPSPRWGASMSYDATTGTVYLFGGTDGTADYNDTWEYSSGTWREVDTQQSPPVRFGSSLASTDGGFPVLFGGYGTSGVLNDTWMLVNDTWLNLTSQFLPGVSSPFPQGGISMVASDGIYANSFIMAEGIPSQNTTFSTWMLVVPQGGNPGGLSATVTASTLNGTSPLTVKFTASATGGLPPYNYTWNFTLGGGTAQGATVIHTFRTSFTQAFDVTLLVTDSRGDVASEHVSIKVLAGPSVPPYSPPPPWVLYGIVGAVVALLVTWTSLEVRGRVMSGRERKKIIAGLGLKRTETFTSLLMWSFTSFLERKDPRELFHSILLYPSYLRMQASAGVEGFSRRLIETLGLVLRALSGAIAKLVFVVTIVFALLETGVIETQGARLTEYQILSGWTGFLGAFFNGSWLNSPDSVFIAPTLELAAVSLILSVLISYPLGMLSGWRHGGTVDGATRTYSALGLFFPTIIFAIIALGSLYIYWVYAFGQNASIFGILPTSASYYEQTLGSVPTWISLYGTTTPTGFTIIDVTYHGAWQLDELVIAATLLQGSLIALIYSTVYLRYLRLTAAEVSEEPFVTAGRARGISESRLLWKHASRQSMPIFVSAFSTTFGAFLFTVTVVEVTFQDIGIGTEIWGVLQGNVSVTALLPLVFIFTIAVVVTNAVSDMLIRVLDKRTIEASGLRR